MMGFNETLPFYLRGDFFVPSILNCDSILHQVQDPLFQYQIHRGQIELHEGFSDQLWCQISKSRKIFLVAGEKTGNFFPEKKNLQEKTGNFFSGKKIFEDENLEFFEIFLDPGFCLYVPKKFYRQFQAPDETVTIFYSWTKKFDAFCKPKFNRTLQEIFFEDQKESIENFQSTWAIRHYASYLPHLEEECRK